MKKNDLRFYLLRKI